MAVRRHRQQEQGGEAGNQQRHLLLLSASRDLAAEVRYLRTPYRHRTFRARRGRLPGAGMRWLQQRHRRRADRGGDAVVGETVGRTGHVRVVFPDVIHPAHVLVDVDDRGVEINADRGIEGRYRDRVVRGVDQVEPAAFDRDVRRHRRAEIGGQGGADVGGLVLLEMGWQIHVSSF